MEQGEDILVKEEPLAEEEFLSEECQIEQDTDILVKEEPRMSDENPSDFDYVEVDEDSESSYITSEFKYISGLRKNSKLLFLTSSKQLFKIKSKTKTVSRYVCYVENCNVSAKVSNHICTLSKNSRHNHDPPEALIKKLNLLNAVKNQCEKNLKRKGIREIFEEECQKAGEAGSLVNFLKIRRQLFKIQSKGMPSNPTSPLETKLLFENEEFLTEYGISKHIKGPFYRQTILEKNFAYTIFLSPSISEIIKNNPGKREYSIDGTLSTVPSCGYKNLIVVHFHFMDHTYPFIYILLSGKSTEAYKHLFGFINQHIFQFEAASFMTDYDSDLRKALTAIFPKATLNSCWFHYCQALRQKSLSIKTFGRTIKRNVNCYNWYQKFQSLALVDPKHIEPMFATLKLDLLNLPKESHKVLQIFLKYFEEEWMIKITPQKFTVHRQNMTTTISLESFNTTLGRKLQKHCRFLKFLEVIRDEDFTASTVLSNTAKELLIAPTEKRSKQRSRRNRIQKVVDEFNDQKISLDDFFKDIVNKDIVNKEMEPLQWDSNMETTDTDSDNGQDEEECHEPEPGPIQMVDVLKCIICNDKPRDVALMPCGHFKMCSNCLYDITAKAKTNDSSLVCPCCRKLVKNHIKIIQ